MEAIELEEALPLEAPDWIDLFNLPDFFELHKIEASLYISIKYKGRLVGVCHFTETGHGNVRSPFKGTYGGISLSSDLSFQSIQESVICVIDYLRKKNFRSVEIVTEPFSHNLHKSSVILSVLLKLGFFIDNYEVNHSIAIDGNSLVSKMMRNNRKRYNKCLNAEYRFDEAYSEKDKHEVYNLIRENRESNGYVISMSFKQILDMDARFVDRLHFFRVFYEEKLVASSVCIKISSDVLYVFYWADKKGYETFSPVVFLASGIYAFAQRSEFKILDIGTSSLMGLPNLGLIGFKENLGFRVSPKLTYKINL